MSSKSRPTPNPRLDALIAELHELLGPAEAELERAASPPARPLVLVLGAPRGGTTLLMQWLAASGVFAVPTNLLARLSHAPAIAARLQRLLTDPALALDGDLFDLAGETGFESNLGKTRGALAPNEYWFFWRRFLATKEIQPLGEAGLAASDTAGLVAALGALEAALERPLAMKGLMLQYDLAAFAELLPTAFFLHVERDVVFNAQSLLEARERYEGSRERWWSVKPAEYSKLLRLDPEQQVVGQILGTHAAIRRGLAGVGGARSLSVDYAAFCAEPGAVWAGLREKLEPLGAALPARHPGPASFRTTDVERLESATMRRLHELADDASLAAE